MGLFREQALAAYASPDARGGLLRAAPPSGLVLFLLIVGTLACGTAVAATTRVSSSVEGRGVVALEHGALVVRAASDGTITAVNVSPGATLDAPRELVAIDGDSVATAATGHVEFVDVRVGDVVTRGTPLVEIVPDREPLVGYLLVPASERSRLSVGQTVRLHAGSASARRELLGSATITDISARPISSSRETELFGTSDTPSGGLELLVRLALPRAPALTNGATFVGEIPLESRSALSVLVPALADDSALDEDDDEDDDGSAESGDDGDRPETGDARSGS